MFQPYTNARDFRTIFKQPQNNKSQAGDIQPLHNTTGNPKPPTLWMRGLPWINLSKKASSEEENGRKAFRAPDISSREPPNVCFLWFRASVVCSPRLMGWWTSQQPKWRQQRLYVKRKSNEQHMNEVVFWNDSSEWTRPSYWPNRFVLKRYPVLHWEGL